MDTQRVIEKLFELLGGREKALQEAHEEYLQAARRWETDTEKVGRILRAHLFVEHFLSEYLRKKNPELGSIEEARLSFAQKVALVGEGDSIISYLLPGIRLLNSVRNRISHSLTADVSDDDAKAFLSIEIFRAFREVGARPNTPSTDPVDILEDFAKFAGTSLQANVSEFSKAWGKAFLLVRADETHRQET